MWRFFMCLVCYDCLNVFVVNADIQQGVDNEEQGYDGVDHERPGYDGVDHEGPGYDGVDHERPGYDSVDHEGPDYDGVDHERPGYDGVDHEGPGYDGVGVDHEGPGYDGADYIVKRVKRGGYHYCQSPNTTPCVHGICSSNDGGHAHYHCSCYIGWKGRNCDVIDCSSPLYCKNGGTCYHTNRGSNYACNCAAGWGGSNCEYVDCNSPVHCGKNGDCQTTNGGRDKTCVCYYGWKGQKCENIDVCTPYKKADIAFVIDTSMSECNASFDDKKKYVQNFMSKYQVGPPTYRYQFSLVTYSLKATVHFYLNTYNNDTEIQNTMEHLTVDCGGPSLTGTALKKVRQDVYKPANGARDLPDVERYVILLTDGLSSDPNDALSEANALKDNGVKIYTFGSGFSIHHEELLEISSFYYFAFPMATEDGLQSLLRYTMFGCDKCSTKMSDVAVLMDVSASMNPRDFDTQLKSVTHLITLTAVGSNATLFSYSTFSNDVVDVYNFTTYYDRASLVAEVHKKTRQDSNCKSANLTKVLNTFKQNGFLTLRGSRPEARKILVLVTSENMNDTEEIRKVAKQLKDSGVFIVTICTGRCANWINLREISSDPTLTFIIGDDIHVDVTVLDFLRTTLSYEYCSNV